MNQIIERGLHTSDEEIKLYTTNLVDKLEQVRQVKRSQLSLLGFRIADMLWGQQFKSENADNDTVIDNVAAHAYVEQFALEVFNRADAAMGANKVSK